jgi:ubiquitin-protein ligase
MIGWDRRTMYETPRLRRLRNDLAAMERLRDESSVLRFKAAGKPAQHYMVELRGRSLARHRGKVTVSERHEVEIKLGASYPRSMPELRWLTPIYHPNISEIGMVCLGGYGTHWVPSLNLDELVGMLWDMARYHNYNVRSPYNRDAALWVANQTTFAFPLDPRPLRDLRAKLGRIAPVPRSPDLADVEHDSADFIPVDELEAVGEPEPASQAPAPVASEDDGGLIILDPVETVAVGPRPAESDRAVRLRAQDEEIVFIE